MDSRDRSIPAPPSCTAILHRHLATRNLNGRDCRGSERFSITRVVFNRIPKNDFDIHFKADSLNTASGASLIDLYLLRGHLARLHLDDLSDLYPAFVAVADRAKTNVLGKVFATHQCSGFKAHHKL